MDIRKYFGNNKTNKAEADTKIKPLKGKRVIESDSEEEHKHKPSPKKKVKHLATVDPAEFFGHTSIESKPKKNKKGEVDSCVSDKKRIKSSTSQTKNVKNEPKSPQGENFTKHISLEATENSAFDTSSKQRISKSPKTFKLSTNGNQKSTPRKSKNEEVITTSSKCGESGNLTKNKSEATPKSKVAEEYPQSDKKSKAIAYAKFLHREGPSNPGGKEIPKGKKNCLSGMTFVVTGVMESLERDQIEDLIKSYGGRVTHSISHKTTYLIVGQDPGQSKLKKAADMKTRQLTEDGLLDLIGNSKSNSEDQCEETATPKPELPKVTCRVDVNEDVPITIPRKLRSDHNMMLVDKYKPTSTKQIIGQQGDRSCLKKLQFWLSHWYENNQPGSKKSRPSPWAKNDDGGYFKAVLLSGPPGIGKTTTAQLVARELGFDVVELNASDTRSKSSLHGKVGELLTSKAIVGFSKGLHLGKAVTSKHLLILDEVDGMAGNEDRGGINEVIQLIKATKVPVVCICNDRSHPKIRSLVNYCFDLRFPKPRLEQIKGAIMSILFKEGLPMKAETVNSIIASADHDVRQILNNISLWAASGKTLDSEKILSEAALAKKDIVLGPWDVVKKVFSSDCQKSMSISERSDLFFYDYSLEPLFVQENYLNIKPKTASNIKEELIQLSLASDAIATGDLISKAIMSRMSWSLLPVQAIFSSVIPGYEMAGNFTKQIEFPSWFGKNSKAKKSDRLLSELQLHMRTVAFCSKEDLSLDYLERLYNGIYKPLAESGQNGIQESLKLLDSYYLLREDLDSLNDLCDWSLHKNLTSLVETKVKAAFTRAMNKENRLNPYNVDNIKKALKRAERDEFDETVEDEEVNEDDIPIKKIEKKITAKGKRGKK